MANDTVTSFLSVPVTLQRKYTWLYFTAKRSLDRLTSISNARIKKSNQAFYIV